MRTQVAGSGAGSRAFSNKVLRPAPRTLTEKFTKPTTFSEVPQTATCSIRCGLSNSNSQNGLKAESEARHTVPLRSLPSTLPSIIRRSLGSLSPMPVMLIFFARGAMLVPPLKIWISATASVVLRLGTSTRTTEPMIPSDKFST